MKLKIIGESLSKNKIMQIKWDELILSESIGIEHHL